MKHKTLGIIIVIIIIAIGGFLLVRNFRSNGSASIFTASSSLKKDMVISDRKSARMDTVSDAEKNTVPVAQTPTQNPPVAAGGTAPINVTPAPTTCPASGYKYVMQWGTRGAGNGQFFQPQSMAADSSGNIYVVDSGNHRVQKFNSNGVYITQWGTSGTGNGQFTVMWNIVVDSWGNVYVGDSDGVTVSRVQKFTSNGVYITQWGNVATGNGPFSTNQFSPGGLAIDSVGNVYVGDRLLQRIIKFTSNGTFIAQWGSQGTGNGQFSFINDVAIDSADNVYAVDTANIVPRIQKFTSNGTYVAQWGTRGTGNGQFDFPINITSDSLNNIYVADNANNRIQKFDSNGNYLAQLGILGSGNGQFNGPHGVVVSHGYLYVLDFRNYRIQKFAPCTPAQVQANTAKSIRGKVYNDRNTNGTFDGSDTALANAKVSLFPLGQNTPIQTVTASSAGEYSFTNLADGTYYVGLWSETYYSNITQPATGNGIIPAHAHIYTITVTNGQGAVNKDFGVVAITTY